MPYTRLTSIHRQASSQALGYLSFASRVVPVHSYVVVHAEHVILLELAAGQEGRRQLARDQGLGQGDGRWVRTIRVILVQ